MVSFKNDILPLFRPKDINHMKRRGLDLSDFGQVKATSQDIFDRVSSTDANVRMPRPPDSPWTKEQIELFRQWMLDGHQP